MKTLLERLQYHIKRLYESSEIAFVINRPGYRIKDTVVYKNFSSNELQQFIRQEWREEGARGLFYRGNWYFWNGLGALHDTVARRLGMNNEIEIIAASVEIDRSGKYLSNDFFHRTAELEEKLDLKEFTFYLVQLIKTLKSLKTSYHINLEDIFYDLYRCYKRKKWPQDSREDFIYSRMNKQQRHDYRVNKQGRYADPWWYKDIKWEDL